MTNRTPFEYFVIVKQNGEMITKVKNSRQHLCEDIYQVTDRLGTTISDDEIPEGDCETVDRQVTVGFDDE